MAVPGEFIMSHPKPALSALLARLRARSVTTTSTSTPSRQDRPCQENPSEEVIKMRQARLSDRALKRVQVPQDLVGTVLFLSSPLSDFMTGQTVAVDGGVAFL